MLAYEPFWRVVPQAQLCRARLAHTLQLALDVHGLALDAEAAAPLMEASTCLCVCVDCPESFQLSLFAKWPVISSYPVVTK